MDSCEDCLPDQPIPAGDSLRARPGVQRLVDRPRREAEVRRLAARPADPRQRVQQAPLQVLSERRLVRDAAGLLDPDRRRDHRLVRAALRPERDAARRADQDRLAAGVDAERPRLQRAGHERVVDRADGEQRLAVARPRRAELAEQPDQVHLGDAELDVAAVVGLAPAHERVGVVGEPVDPVAQRPDPGLVDPAAEVRRRPDVRRDGHDPLGDGGRLAREVDEEAAERLLRGLRAAVLAAEVGRDRGRLDGEQRLGALQPPGGRGAQLRGRAAGRERCPRIGRVGADLRREGGVLLVVEQRGVVGGVPLGGQRPALDRVREDHGRPVADRIGLAVAVEQRAEVVAAEVAERRQQRRVVEPAGVDLQPRAQLVRRGAQQPLVLLVRHQVDALAQPGPGGQLRPVLDHHAVPARRLEHRLQPPGGDVRDHAVERLPVEVDDPHDLAELAHHRVGDRLPARALVELGVADQRDLAAADGDVEVPGDVAVGERAPHRRRRAEPDRAGGVVDGIRVLRARRIGLQAAELAQRLQVGAVEPAEQVVDRVQDGRGVRLHAHPVRRLQHAEPQRGHERHHRRARRLVPADLHP